MAKKSTKKKPRNEPAHPRQVIQSGIVKEDGVRCYHCGARSMEHKVTNTYPNGNRRRICADCGKRFISTRPDADMERKEAS